MTSPRPEQPVERSAYSLDIQRRVEALADTPDARDHDEVLPNGAGHSWLCVPVSGVIDAIEAADRAARASVALDGGLAAVAGYYSDVSAAIEALPSIVPDVVSNVYPLVPGGIDRETVLGILRAALRAQPATPEPVDVEWKEALERPWAIDANASADSPRIGDLTYHAFGDEHRGYRGFAFRVTEMKQDECPHRHPKADAALACVRARLTDPSR